MNSEFAVLVESIESSFQRLMDIAPVSAGRLPPAMPERGIYLFSEGAAHKYVGRSDNIRRRIGLHCRAGSQHNQATFAFRMARHRTGRRAAYTTAGSRSQMVKEDAFGQMFASCKTEIRSLDLRFVEETDATRQALLEIYVATVLKTPFNDFENH